MAEIKWTNVDGSNMNQATQLMGNRADVMYDRVKDLNSVFQTQLSNMQKGITEQFEYEKEQNTQQIINQMLGAESQADIDRMRALGIDKAEALTGKFGNKYDLSKINQTKATWNVDTLTRSTAKDDLKDYTPEAQGVMKQVQILAREGNIEQAQDLLGKSGHLLSSKTFNNLRSTLYTENEFHNNVIKDKTQTQMQGISIIQQAKNDVEAKTIKYKQTQEKYGVNSQQAIEAAQELDASMKNYQNSLESVNHSLRVFGNNEIKSNFPVNTETSPQMNNMEQSINSPAINESKETQTELLNTQTGSADTTDSVFNTNTHMQPSVLDQFEASRGKSGLNLGTNTTQVLNQIAYGELKLADAVKGFSPEDADAVYRDLLSMFPKEQQSNYLLNGDQINVPELHKAVDTLINNHNVYSKANILTKVLPKGKIKELHRVGALQPILDVTANVDTSVPYKSKFDTNTKTEFSWKPIINADDKKIAKAELTNIVLGNDYKQNFLRNHDILYGFKSFIDEAVDRGFPKAFIMQNIDYALTHGINKDGTMELNGFWSLNLQPNEWDLLQQSVLGDGKTTSETLDRVTELRNKDKKDLSSGNIVTALKNYKGKGETFNDILFNSSQTEKEAQEIQDALISEENTEVTKLMEKKATIEAKFREYEDGTLTKTEATALANELKAVYKELNDLLYSDGKITQYMKVIEDKIKHLEMLKQRETNSFRDNQQLDDKIQELQKELKFAQQYKSK